MKIASTSLFVLATIILALVTPFSSTQAQDEVTIHILLKNHNFQPKEVRAPKDTPLLLQVQNADTTPAEFESRTLRVEKVVPGQASGTLHIRPLQPGRYRFFDDYREATTEGFLVVE